VAIDGVVWGVLEVDAVERDRFDDDDERFLVAFALVLALGVRLQQGHADRERTAVDLGRRLLQTETLLKEQNHRVHNNFQIILSILANRSHKAADAQIRAEFEGAMDRVAAVALAHDQLTFRGGAQTHVNAGTYVDALCLGLERATEGELHIERDAEPLELRADRAGPLGLILNELLTNAIKYAAKDRPQASIRVRLTSNGAEALLAVSDDGPGMGEPRTGSMGLKLVESLAAQLSGRLEVDSSSDGTTVRLYFPLVE
jgi:two-component sensor histidine kinase